MRSIWSVLPLFLIRWFAVRHCERFMLHGRMYVRPFGDVLIEIDSQ